MLRRVFLVLACALLAGPQARAQPPPAEQQLVRIASISPWAGPDHPFRLALQVTNATEAALDRVLVRVTFFGRVGSRSELREALDRGARSAPIGSIGERLDEPIPAGAQRRVVLERDAVRLPSRRSGVYPLEILVRHATGETTLRSALPVFASPPRAPLNLVWIVPVARPIVTPPDGIYAADALDRLALDELAQQLGALAEAPPAAVTLAPSPALLDTLADLSDGFARRTGGGEIEVVAPTGDAPVQARVLVRLMRRAAAATDVAAAPYAGADLPSLATRGLGEDLLRQVSLGRRVLEGRLGRALDGATLAVPGGRLDPASAAALAGLGETAPVLAPESLAAPLGEPFRPDQFGPSRPVSIRAGAAEARALLLDRATSDRIDASRQGTLLAQALVAETASAFFELPLHAPERVLVISSRTLPSPVALRAALHGFTRAPWLRLAAASEVLADLPPQGPPVELAALRAPDRPYLAAARLARRQLTLLSDIALSPPPDAPSLERLVLRAESAEWDGAPGGGVALADAVGARVRAVTRVIGLAGDKRITLTSRRGRVPVHVANRNDFPVRVRVLLRSPKVDFLQGAVSTQEIPAQAETQIDVLVELRATGAFPLDVRIETPDGSRLLGRGQLILRSTAISAVALAVVGGSAVVLLFSWAARGARRRRPAKAG